MKKLLQVGDKIYAKNYSKVIAVHVVERVTKTKAICKNGFEYRVEYDSDSGHISKMGDTYKWGSASCYIETPELQDTFYRQNTIDTIKNYPLHILQTEDLRQIEAILQKGMDKIIINKP